MYLYLLNVLYREQLNLIDLVNSEISRIEAGIIDILGKEAGPASVRSAKDAMYSRKEFEELAVGMNSGKPKATLISESLHLTESLAELSTARDRLLRVCELRRRQIEEMASLAAVLSSDIGLE